MKDYNSYIRYYDVDFYDWSWLCGIFEAEGSFVLAPPAASKNQHGLKISMRDKSCIDKVGQILRSTTLSYENNVTMYRIALNGVRAIEVMKLMYPYMSVYRRNTIDNILNNFNYDFDLPLQKEIVLQIKNDIDNKVSYKNIINKYNIGRSSIHLIKNNKHITQRDIDYKYEFLIPKIEYKIKYKKDMMDFAFKDISVEDFYWFAGLIDGDGCFLNNKYAKNIKIRLSMKDLEIINKVCSMWDLKYYDATKGRYYLEIIGLKALSVMDKLYPLMGVYRKNKIDLIFSDRPDKLLKAKLKYLK
jgi:hypothetical protein